MRVKSDVVPCVHQFDQGSTSHVAGVQITGPRSGKHETY